IEDVFGIKGRGTVATGRIERGVIKVGEEIEILGIREARKAVVTGVEMVMPGDNANLEITLITPIALEEGLRFAIREGGRTVGAGVVTKILE
ncbi:MAG: EF-Tu/IF-2/RF-3 family GTPase, partial [Candidatus Limnocylindria bacterium]|nr:EF-Tu/IF-2/RF-3 family GTPase [Candidatus Limnocylindria bacterium]